MASAPAASARLLSSIFSSTARRGRSPKPAPAPAPAPAPIARVETEAKPNAGRDCESRRALGKVLQRIFGERDPEKLASKFIAFSTVFPPFRDHPRVYVVAVDRLASAGCRDAVAAILNSQKRFLETSGADFAARLIGLYGRASMPSHAAAAFRDLPSKHKTVTAFNALLAAYSASDDPDALVVAFREIPASHPTIVPNAHSYNMLIGALCKKKPADLSADVDPIALMEKREERGLASDTISFDTLLLNGLYTNGRYDDVEKVWAMMEKRNVEPSTVTYNTKLRILVADGRIGDAAAAIELMQKDGPKPDAVSYNELIRAYCKEGRLDEAKKVYRDLVNNGCAPNKDTFHSLLPHLVEAGELDLSIKCCHEIFRSRNLRVKCLLLQEVVTALVAASRVEEARRIAELGRKNHRRYNRWNRLRMPQCTRENKELKMPMPSSTGGNNVVEAEADWEERFEDE